MTTLGNGVVIDESHNSPNFTDAASTAYYYGQGRSVKGVTVHHWGVDGQDFDQVRDFLCRANGNTSAHTVLQGDRVATIISPDDTAWHAGSATGNATTVGIECRPEMGADDLETLAQYISYLQSVYGDLVIYVHQDWFATACPGRYVSKRDWLVNRVNEIELGSPAKVTVQPAPVVDPHTRAKNAATKVQPKWIVEQGDTLSKIARYYKGEATRENVKAIADANKMRTTDKLTIGQEIKIPSPLVWVVERGDTWEKIADYYDFDVDYLKSLNPGSKLAINDSLVIY